jgi:hypothetical protein
MKRKREERRGPEAAGKATYLTLLPDMDEGFHTGYQAAPAL